MNTFINDTFCPFEVSWNHFDLEARFMDFEDFGERTYYSSEEDDDDEIDQYVFNRMYDRLNGMLY